MLVALKGPLQRGPCDRGLALQDIVIEAGDIVIEAGGLGLI